MDIPTATATATATAKDRRQFNMRLDDSTAARLDRLRVDAARRLGIPVNNAVLFRLALVALEEKLAHATDA